jgi:hypothetical protein
LKTYICDKALAANELSQALFTGSYKRERHAQKSVPVIHKTIVRRGELSS